MLSKLNQVFRDIPNLLACQNNWSFGDIDNFLNYQPERFILFKQNIYVFKQNHSLWNSLVSRTTSVVQSSFKLAKCPYGLYFDQC